MVRCATDVILARLALDLVEGCVRDDAAADSLLGERR
jgi:hypothetical protein